MKKRLVVLMLIFAIFVLSSKPHVAAAEAGELTKRADIGDEVSFGTYEQDGNFENGKEKIEWLVLDEENGTFLLISKEILALRPYHWDWLDTTWKECTLRKWLNRIFFHAAFDKTQRKMIEKTKVFGDDNEEFGVTAGPPTRDKVFILSADEVNRYFATDEDRVTFITKNSKEELKQKILSAFGGSTTYYNEFWHEREQYGETGWWWLRTPGYDSGNAAVVDFDGSIKMFGENVNDGNIDGGIRPVIRVKP